MNATEDRLRDALSAHAGTLRHPPDAWRRTEERLRDRRPRWQPYAAAAVAVLATVLLVDRVPDLATRPVDAPTGTPSAAASPEPEPTPTPTPTPTPAALVPTVPAVPPGPARVLVHAMLGPARLLDTATGRTLLTVRLPAGSHATAVAALDRSTYFVGYSAPGCRGHVARVRVRDTATGIVADVERLFGDEPLPGRVEELAVTPDGTRLAMALYDTPYFDADGKPVMDNARPCHRANLAVRDVAGGTMRTWYGPHRDDYPTLTDEIYSLSFSPDGRTIAFSTNYYAGARLLEVDAPEGDYVGSARLIREPSGNCNFFDPVYQGTTGRIAAIRLCEEGRPSELFVFDPADVRTARTIGRLPGVWSDHGTLDFDPTGEFYVTTFCLGEERCEFVAFRGRAGGRAERLRWRGVAGAAW